MYGLMKARSCSRHPEEASRRRLHYCGTCKTMGRLYGQKARFLLNNDAVFLAELLTALATDPEAPKTWAPAYQSFNCLSLPKTTEQMPLALQVAATATMAMTAFKVADQIADAGHGGWRLANQIYARNFEDAFQRLQGWGFPVDRIEEWSRKQDVREAEIRAEAAGRTSMEILAYLAEATAAVTGLVFQHGARVVGGSPEIQATMYTLGHAFGELIYTLDAFEDFEKDGRQGDFNALQAAFRPSGPQLPTCYRGATANHLRGLANQVEAALGRLPLAQTASSLFAARLDANLTRKVGEDPASHLEAANTPHACASRLPKLGMGLKERFSAARSLAGELTVRHREQRNAAIPTTLALPFVFTSVFLIALVLPRQALAATSYQECVGMAFNLMFLTAAVSALLTAPMRLLPAYQTSSDGGSGGIENGQAHSESVVKVRRRRAPCGENCCCGSCDSDACSNCLCCCEGVDCCANCGSLCECCSSCS